MEIQQANIGEAAAWGNQTNLNLSEEKHSKHKQKQMFDIQLASYLALHTWHRDS